MEKNYLRPDICIMQFEPEKLLSSSTTNPYDPIDVPDNYLTEDE